jgi:hypothetical protein
MRCFKILKALPGFLAAAALFATGASAQMLPASALQGKRALLVTSAPDPDHHSDDLLVKKHLESLGFTVTVAKETDPPSKAQGEDLVVLSSTADPHILQSAYKDSPVPIFTWNAADYPNLAMTGPHLHTDFDVVEPVQAFARSYSVLYGYGASATSPIAREVGLANQLFGTFYLMPATAGWGRPAPAATVVTTFEGDPGKAGLFTYEKGASMVGDYVAPARRVGFFLADDNFHLLTAAYGPAENDPELKAWYVGLKLFDAAIRWAVSPAPVSAPYDPAALAAKLAQAAKGKKLLFVERKNTPEGAEADAHMVERLRAAGFEVTVADQMDPQSRVPGYDIIVLSATCSKYKLANKYRDLPIPVLCLEGLFADTLRMAGRDRYVDYGEHGEEKESDDPPENYIDIVGAYHPMAAGLPPGLVQILKERDVIKWATASPGAIIIATLPNEQEEQAIFGYPKGATMAYGYLAPARRALFPLDNPAFDDLTPQGLALFDAVVLWTLNGD